MRYHGGKFKLKLWIYEFLPAHQVYVEPFGGAASVLMGKPRVYCEVYNDLDSEIVNVFRVLRDPAEAAALERLCFLTPYSHEEFDAAYEKSADPVEQARRTIVKSFLGFGSASATLEAPTSAGGGFWAPTGFRSNSNRNHTTPATDWANYPKEIRHFTERLRGVVIENRDAKLVMAQHDRPDCLHYVDPPYIHSTRKVRKYRNCKGYRHEMTDHQHLSLLEFLQTLEGMVVLNGHPHEMYDQALPGWRKVEKTVKADGGGHGYSTSDRVECLWLNPATQAGLQRSLFEFSGA